MWYKAIGHLGEKISVIGHGCSWGRESWASGLGEKRIELIRHGIELGINLIDTAEIYGEGYSEEVIGRALQGSLRKKAFIATKVSPENLSREAVIRSAESSLKRLKTDTIDLYQIHWPNPKISFSDTFSGLSRLIQDGKIRYTGVCNLSFFQFQELRHQLSDISLDSLQAEYNLFDRSAEGELLPYCQKHKLLFIAYAPLNRGQMTGFKEKENRLQKIADKYKKTKAQVALNFLASHSPVVTISTMSSKQHLEENASACDFELSEEDLRLLDECLKTPTEWIMPDRIGVSAKDSGGENVYRTVEEALSNRLGFIPSPEDLAKEILREGLLKPVKVSPIVNQQGTQGYELIDGKIRYWAWVIAYGYDKPMPCYVMASK